MKKTITLLILVCSLGTGCSTHAEPEVSQYAIPATFENLTIGGELLQRVMKNFDRLEEELYQPDHVFVDEVESNGWPGDKEGRTILALTLESRLSKRKPLYLEEIIRRIPDHVNEKGYFGIIYEDTMNEQQLSGNGWMLRGLCEYYQWKQDPAVLETIRDIVENLFIPGKGFYARYPIDPTIRDTNVGAMSGTTQKSVDGWMLSSDIGCIFIGMEGAIHAYSLVPSPELKAVIDEMIARLLTIDLKQIKAQTHASLTALRGVIRYANLTGDYSLIPEVEKRWQLYLTDGTTENHENYNWFDRFDSWTEPCGIIDAYMVAMQLWQLTQKDAYLRDAELMYYNGLSHTQRHNGGFGCDNCPGDHDPYLRVHADEAYWCCTMRGGEGLSRVGEYSCYMKQDTIIVPFYRELTARFARENGQQVIVAETTRYPFDGGVEFRIVEQSMDHPVLKIHVPSWTGGHRLFINDREEKLAIRDNYLTVDRLAKGDVIRLSFELLEQRKPVINTHHAAADQYRLFRGPLQFGETDGRREPIYHLMNPQVKEGAYARQILFRD